MRKTMNAIIVIGIIGLFFWVSFIPQRLHTRTFSVIKAYLWFILLLSLINYRFKIYDFFFKGYDKYIWGYVLLLCIGLINPLDKILARNFYIGLSSLAISIYFILKNEINESNLKTILLYFVIFAFMVSIIGILEILFGKNIIYTKYVYNEFYERYISQKRMMATLTHPNILGCYLLASAPIAYYFYASAKASIRKNIHLFIFLIILLSILVTFSRGTWLSVLITVSLYLFLKKKLKSLILVWLIFFTLIITIGPFISMGGMKHRFNLPIIFSNAIKDHRAIQYSVTFNMLKDHPFKGIGLNNYKKNFIKYSKNELYNEVRTSDSIYLMQLAETGLIGFTGFVAVLYILLKRCILFLRKYRDSNEIYLFISLSFFGILLNMAFFDAFLWPTTLCLFWIFAGLLTLADFKNNENSPLLPLYTSQERG